MPLTLTDQDAEELWQTDRARVETVCQPDPFEVQQTWQSKMGQGYSRDIQLRDLWLNIEASQVTEDVIYQHETASWGPISSFFIAGTARNQHLGLTGENVERPGWNYLEGIQSGAEVDHLFAAEPTLRVRLGLKVSSLSQFGESLPPELLALVAGVSPPSFYRQGITTPNMQVILHQILHCPYQGAIKQMYLEGKVLELTALQFAQFTVAACPTQAEARLNADEKERLQHAKDILTHQFHDPPSILALARQVGLNDFKLKQGFRNYFGTTVFGYLREYRLEQAQLLLSDEQLSIQQVARAIGYTHAGYFAAAFKHKFGVSPKAYQRGSNPNRPTEVKKSVKCYKKSQN
jgi:AraC family transcriptional regulator, transcriptional activator of the genes for pyochelin and ferripyochelin receptors